MIAKDGKTSAVTGNPKRRAANRNAAIPMVDGGNDTVRSGVKEAPTPSPLIHAKHENPAGVRKWERLRQARS
jgi:hypothetical protein